MTTARRPNPADIELLAARLRGHSLPGGHYTIRTDEADVVARLLHLPNRLHPIFSCIAALKSLGVSLSELCRLCEFDLADGPLLGEFGVRFTSPLLPRVRYTIAAMIDSIDRTHSKRLGTLDRLQFTVAFIDPDGTTALEARFLWILPRGSALT